MKAFFSAIIIFVIVFFLAFVIFTGRFGLLVDAVIPREKTDQELMDVLTERNYGISPFWLERYSVRVRSEADLTVDADVDGLTLREEYVHNTHPFVADTDGDTYNDGAEVDNGYSPTGKGRLDANHNGLPDDWEEKYSFDGDVRADGDEDGDALTNEQEFLYGTDPTIIDTDGDGYGDGKEVRDGYDPITPGEARLSYSVIIDGIGVDAPIVISDSVEESILQKDLERGVILYPGLAAPGQVGNSYIAGHSSNYSWAGGNFNTVFKDLIHLSPGDEIIVAATTAQGREVRHSYVVQVQREVEADEPEIFASSGAETLTLTTCWPLGTALRRIMVKATLVDTDEELVYNYETLNGASATLPQ